ncbi:beta-lactamase superfamily domain protein [Mycobacterium xenopi 3993]|nr:beta-lactamase superfamily domain protein [Mycobacterium xenopi 3993]
MLTDPVWSHRCSPSDVIGPDRLHPPPMQVDALPAVDAVVISHDHYDHLDIDTVIALAHSQWAPFVVPLGVGAHLRAWASRTNGSSNWIGSNAPSWTSSP